MLLDILEPIAEEQKPLDEEPKLPATETEILELKKLIAHDYSRDAWFAEYVAFLEIWNENEWEDDYVFFGDSNISWYCYSRMKNAFMELDKPSGDVINKFSSFSESLVLDDRSSLAYDYARWQIKDSAIELNQNISGTTFNPVAGWASTGTYATVGLKVVGSFSNYITLTTKTKVTYDY